MKNNTTFIFLTIAICLILFGAMRGEVSEVLSKGINLCLECVGIG